ncbi:hypothetical protein [Limnobaculum parvum]|nr:hypothetical protein [Limnobaculum parvum]
MMTNTLTQTTPDTSITILRTLIADLQYTQLSDIELHDLSSIAAESIEGLCHGLLHTGESLENGIQPQPQNLGQLGAWLKASAHIIPILLELYEQSTTQLFQMQNQNVNHG